jgi:hypothetical protein
MALTTFHPVHLADLQKSGLTEDDAGKAGLYTARPGDLNRLCGRAIPDGTTGLVFPYPNADGHRDGFVRVKLFPPLVDADGHTIRYLQRVGSPPRAYFPPGVERVLGSDQPLAIVEGEKKALAIAKAGVACVGIGGIWNFVQGGELIPDLKAISWRNRLVRFVPDGDVWSRNDLRRAVFQLGRLLEAEGATVSVVQLPSTLPGLSKVGADDFLVAQGAPAFQHLWEEAIPLNDPSFRADRAQEKRRAGATKVQAPLPATLAGRRLHPAIHVEPDGFASVGVLSVGPDGKPTLELVTSTRERFPAAAVTRALVTPPIVYTDLVARWPRVHVDRFLAAQNQPPRFAEAVSRVFDAFDRLVETRREPEMTVLALWTVATYFHPLFSAFPRLDLRGERGSGKSKVLSIVAALAFHGLLRVSPTPAVLFRMIEALRPTFCLDEIEGLAGEDKQEILAILNAGYKAGGRVDRCEGDAHTVKSYGVYSPVALAGITGLNRVTEDRAITLVLVKGTDAARLNVDVQLADPSFAAIRDICYCLLLTRSAELAEANHSLVIPDWLMARERELWRPLLVLATLAEREEPDLGLEEDLLLLAREQVEERAGLSDEAAALVRVLKEKLEDNSEVDVFPGELCGDLQDALKLKDPPSPQRVGRWIKNLGFPAAPRAAGGKRRRVTAERLAEIQKRYGETS